MANIVHQAPPGGTSTPVDYITMQEALSTAAALAAASTTTVPSSSLQQQARIPPAPIAPIAARSAQVLLANNNNNTMLPTVTPCTTQQAFPYVSYATQPSQLLIFPAPGPFDQLKLRRGKWTSEEEAYAELLIVEFEKGTVEGCENGCTLRSFLSKKLHCAPMRISKKYAGKSIGKHVFLSRATTANGIGKPDGNKSKLQQLETSFYKSLFRESEASTLMPFMPPTATYPVAGMCPTVIASAPPASFLSIPQPYGQQANQLHQTFLNALSQPTAAQISSMPILPVHHLAPLVQAVPQPQVQQLSQAQPPVQGLSQAQPMLSSQIAPRQLAEQPRPATSQLSRHSFQNPVPLDMPDFLSGFEKVAARSTTTEPQKLAINTAESQYSPPFTSRSFDDLHQLLGKGLSPRPFDLNCPPPAFPQVSLGASQGTHPVTADSYAIFAQQSALAVSQHSAYLRTAKQQELAVPTLTGQPTAPPSVTPSVVTAANLRFYSMPSEKHVVSDSEWGTSTEESESTGAQVSDNASDANDSDSNSDEGPHRKKLKVEHMTQPIYFPTGSQ